MKNFLMGTAILAIGSGTVTANSSLGCSNNFTPINFASALNQLNVTLTATGLERGDFESIASQETLQDLYSGAGSSIMASIRMFKY